MKHFLTMYHVTSIMQSIKDMKLAKAWSGEGNTCKQSMAGGAGEEKYNVICDKVYGYRKRMIKPTGGRSNGQRRL